MTIFYLIATAALPFAFLIQYGASNLVRAICIRGLRWADARDARQDQKRAAQEQMLREICVEAE